MLENLLESEGSYHNVSRSSGSHAQSHQGKQVLAPARVQPSRINRSNRLAGIMANIESDDDCRMAVPKTRRKKRQVVESDPEDSFCVPEDIECNPMAPMPVKKKRRQITNVETSLCTGSIPPVLPLQPTPPAQVPPHFQPSLNRRQASSFQLPPQVQSTSELRPQSQESRRQSHPTATSNLTNPSGIPDDDDPMQEEDYQDRITRGWFYFYLNFSFKIQIHYRK